MCGGGVNKGRQMTHKGMSKKNTHTHKYDDEQIR